MDGAQSIVDERTTLDWPTTEDTFIDAPEKRKHRPRRTSRSEEVGRRSGRAPATSMGGLSYSAGPDAVAGLAGQRLPVQPPSAPLRERPGPRAADRLSRMAELRTWDEAPRQATSRARCESRPGSRPVSATRRCSVRPEPARRRRWRGDREGRSPGARHRPQQDARAQLCNEFASSSPTTRSSFVSYDYYQPEAYVPPGRPLSKDSSRNDDIDRLRHAATSNLLSRRASSSSRPSPASTASARPRSTSSASSSSPSRRSTTATWVQAGRHPVRPQRHAARSRPLQVKATCSRCSRPIPRPRSGSRS